MMKGIIIRPEKETEFEIIDEMVHRSFREGTKSDGIGEVELVHEIRASKCYSRTFYVLSFSYIKRKRLG